MSPLNRENTLQNPGLQATVCYVNYSKCKPKPQSSHQ